MKIIKKTDSKRKFVKKELYPIASQVVKRLGNNKFDKVVFLFTKTPKKSFLDIANPERMYHGRRYDKMEYWLSESMSSFSIHEGKEVKILINIKDPHIRSRDYATGLIAHEYMHTILKSGGIEPSISEFGKKQWPFIIKTLQKIGENYENVLNDLVKLTTFFILCMKDLIVDTVLIEKGFEKEVLAERRFIVGEKLEKIKVNRKNISNTMILYIGFHNMWIPLKYKYPKIKIKEPFLLPDYVERECKKVVKELKDVKPGAGNNEKEISEVIKTGLDAYRKIYKKIR